MDSPVEPIAQSGSSSSSSIRTRIYFLGFSHRFCIPPPMNDIIKIIVCPERRDTPLNPNQEVRYEWTAEGSGLHGVSRTPFLDACRELIAAGYDRARGAAMYWEGSMDWSLKSTIGKAAKLTIIEGEERPRFGKFKRYPGSA